MASVTFSKATRLYPGSTRPAVDAIDLEVADGEFLVLVGPSGCGKSTTLRMLAGLEEVNSGDIFIGDRNVTDVPPKDRDIAMVFQNYALYPHMTVAENMGFALKIAGVGKEERATRVLEAAKLLDLEPYLVAQAQGPLRWSAPARRHGPRHRAPAAGVPHGRAAVEPRRQAARADPHPDRLAPAPPRRHHGLRHARPDRGPDHGRPHRGPQGRRPPAGRHPPRPVREAAERLRRRLHRLPRDEPAARRRRRRRHPVRHRGHRRRPRHRRPGQRHERHHRRPPRGRRRQHRRRGPRGRRRRRRRAGCGRLPLRPHRGRAASASTSSCASTVATTPSGRHHPHHAPGAGHVHVFDTESGERLGDKAVVSA